MKPLQILIVEDNEGDVILFQEALEHHHIEHQLHVASDGRAALDYVARMGTSPEIPCPDVMLLDLNLPKADGGTILSEFRKHPECAETPVIVVTSSDAEKDRANVAGFQVARYFRKPSDLDAFMTLGAIVREVVGGRGLMDKQTNGERYNDARYKQYRHETVHVESRRNEGYSRVNNSITNAVNTGETLR